MENHAYEADRGQSGRAVRQRYSKSANTPRTTIRSGSSELDELSGSGRRVQLRRADDNSSSWHDTACMTKPGTGIAATDVPSTRMFGPIWGTGRDAATPAVDYNQRDHASVDSRSKQY